MSMKSSNGSWVDAQPRSIGRVRNDAAAIDDTVVATESRGGGGLTEERCAQAVASRVLASRSRRVGNALGLEKGVRRRARDREHEWPVRAGRFLPILPPAGPATGPRGEHVVFVIVGRLVLLARRCVRGGGANAIEVAAQDRM